MSHQIFPGDVLVAEFGAVIRTKCPKDSITDEMIYKRVLNANLSAGDFVRVQCMNHERTTVLHFAEWLVFDRQTEMKRVEVDDRTSRQFEDVTFGVVRTRDWQATPAGLQAEKEAKEEAKQSSAKKQIPDAA